MDTWLLMMVFASTLGGTIIGMLGWAKQSPPCPFSWRSFCVTVGDSLIAGAVYAVYLSSSSGNLTKDIINAAIFGAGGDMLIKGIIGTAVAGRG